MDTIRNKTTLKPGRESEKENPASDRPTPADPSATGRRLRAGDEILGRYIVLSELGQGGMGVVYKCFDKTGGVEVAVKGLPPDVSHNADEMEEIRDNFQLVGGLRHSAIAGVRTLEQDANGDYYLVMDVAHGTNLGRWMKRHRDEGSFPAKLALLKQMAEALDYAHGKRVMHRDVKPGNVMVDDEGNVQILDFGLAARIRTSLSRVSIRGSSQSGTPPYKSPEQWRGQPQGAAADQYALGVIAYEMLSGGDLPFDSDDPQILREAVLKEPVPAIPGVSSQINKALARALAKTPGERFASCADFIAVLGGGKATGKSAAPTPPRPAPRSRSFTRALFGAAVLALLVLAVAGGILLGQRETKPTVAPAPAPKVEAPPPTPDPQDEARRKEAERREAERLDGVRRKLATGGYVSDQDSEGRLIAVWAPGREVNGRRTSSIEGVWQSRVACSWCQGSGETVRQISCSACQGQGWTRQDVACSACNGSGQVEKQEQSSSPNLVRVACPAGCGQVTRNGQIQFHHGFVCPNCQGRGMIANQNAGLVGGLIGGALAAAFGGNRNRRPPPPPPPQPTVCQRCNGQGAFACPQCRGQGGILQRQDLVVVTRRVACSQCQGRGTTSRSVPCSSCQNGKVSETDRCPHCSGEGRVWRNEQ